MPATGKVNDQTVVHKDSGGQVVTVDVCLTPMGNTMVPVPYVNIAKSEDTTNGSQKLNVDGNPIMLKDSKFAVSSGDSPGKAGVASGTVKGWAKFTNYSSDTFVEGRPVCRRGDPMISNNGNTPPAPLQQQNIEVEKVKAKATHSLTAYLIQEYPDTVTGSRKPLATLPHTATGPETLTGEKAEIYRPIVHLECTEGEYKLSFDKQDTERKELTWKES